MLQSVGQHNSFKILDHAKKTISTIVMDQDGTIKGGDDPKYKKANVAELLQKIARAGKYPVVITASGASALKSFSALNDFYRVKRGFVQEKITNSLPTFIGIGNGTALYRFDTNGKCEIYNHGLTLEEEKEIIEVWQKTFKSLGIKESDLQPKGIKTFRNFMTTDWTSYIPVNFIELFKQYGGQCFTEPIKVTVVFPAWEAEKQRQLTKQMQRELNTKFGKNKYVAKRGDDTYLHITHSFEVDPKLFALRRIMKELSLTDKNVAAFGDSPLDNDRGLLVESRLPYTFTNHEFGTHDFNNPPYILSGSAASPVGSVYKAIDYLLS